MAMIEKQNITMSPPLERVIGTAAESYDELLIDEIAASAAHERLATIGSRLNAVSNSLMNRSTVNNIRIAAMGHQHIANLIAETPEFKDNLPDGQNKQAEHAELVRKSCVAETVVRHAAPETLPREYSYDELIDNRAAISQRMSIIAIRVSAVYIQHADATLKLIKVREQLRATEPQDNS